MGFKEDLGSGNKKTIRDQGLIGPVGYGSPVDYGTRAGWYNWNFDGSGIYTHKNYEYQYDADAGPLDPDPVTRRGFRYYGTPSVHAHPDFGWGNPQKCPNTNTDAYFEWIYGKNGAVKAAVPKYLEFHTLFVLSSVITSTILHIRGKVRSFPSSILFLIVTVVQTSQYH